MKLHFINQKLAVFRDDIYPFLGGGNKGRKMDFIGKYILENNYNAIVTTGGIHSNHCRATAIWAVQHNMPCTLVIHGNKSAFFKAIGNPQLIRASEVKCVFVEANQISTAMVNSVQNYKNDGLNPYYLCGGGHTLEGGLAYIEAINELKLFCKKENWWPKTIYLASGTGSTQAGILAGLARYEIKAEVIGISVGRTKQRAENVVDEFYNQLLEHNKIKSTKNVICVLDDYLCGGYGKYNEAIANIAKQSVHNYGFTLDTTYTAKAFYGLQEHIQKVNQQDNVLFWHTGGFLNYLNDTL